MKGKLIVIEGTDSSGKETQTRKLFERLLGEKCNIMKVEFPDYKSDSSALIKMYLSGKFGTLPEDVNPYAASSFYAVDRFASYKSVWGEFYNNGGIVISDRYTTSNMIHQASKIDDTNGKEDFLKWLYDYEFVKIGLPIPDEVIFLNMPVEMSLKLMEQRKNKATGEDSKDIHEKNSEYMKKSYKGACFVAEKYGWKTISCVEGDRLKGIDEIHTEIYKKIEGVIR